MAPWLFFFIFSTAALALAAYTDIKSRLVDNRLCLAMVVAGLVGNSAWAYLSADAAIFLTALAATAATFAVAYLLWRVGAWAGGDVKLFTGIAALNPFNPAALYQLGILNAAIFAPINFPAFPLSVFIFAVLAMFPYGTFLVAKRLAKNPEVKKAFLVDFRKRLVDSAVVAAIVAGAGVEFIASGTSPLFIIPLLFVVGLIPRAFRIAVGIISFAAAVYFNALPTFAVAFALLVLVYLMLKLYGLSKKVMRTEVKIENLEEGMIPAETIVERDGKIEVVAQRSIKSIINNFAANGLKEHAESARVIASALRAGGLEKKEVEELRALAKAGKVSAKIMVKESTAFVPAVLIAYLILNVVGDLIWNLVL